MIKGNLTIWVSAYHYAAALQKWPHRNIKISTYLSRHPFIIEVTRPGYTVQKRGRFRRVRVKGAQK